MPLALVLVLESGFVLECVLQVDKRMKLDDHNINIWIYLLGKGKSYSSKGITDESADPILLGEEAGNDYYQFGAGAGEKENYKGAYLVFV